MDWYLCSSLLLYLLFPLFYKIIRRVGMFAVFCSIVACCLMYYLYPDIQWQFRCLISRIPVFLLGIAIYLPHFEIEWQKGRYDLCIYIFLLICAIYLHQNNFLIGALLIYPILLIASIYDKQLCLFKTKSYAQSVIIYMGKHSLQIYIANCLMMYSITIDYYSKFWNLIIYSIEHFILILILNAITNKLQKHC